MPRNENMIPLDELFDSTRRAFESGNDRYDETEPDDLRCETYDDENEELPRVAANLKAASRTRKSSASRTVPV